MLQVILGLGSATAQDYDEEIVQLYFEKCVYEACLRGLYPGEAVQFVRQHLLVNTLIMPLQMTPILQLLESSGRSAIRARAAEQMKASKDGAAAKLALQKQNPDTKTLDKNVLLMMGPMLDARLASILGRQGVASSNQLSGAAVGAAAGAAGGPAGMALGAMVGFFAGSAADTVQSALSSLMSNMSDADRIRMINMQVFLAMLGVKGNW